jgi:hypothetical protein
MYKIFSYYYIIDGQNPVFLSIFFQIAARKGIRLILIEKNMRPTEFQDPYNGQEGVFQFTMDHLEKTLLFRTADDYDYGVNALALATLQHPVKLLCYSLMSNHLHLLLKGKFRDCLAYYSGIVRRLRIMLRQRYGVTGVLSENACDVSAVTDERMFLNEIAYILRNPYKARVASPYAFAWNSADVYFNPWRDYVRGLPFGTMMLKEKKALLQSHITVPDEWEHMNGRILNRFFVAYDLVEKRVTDSIRFFDRIRSYDVESIVHTAHGLPERITYTDGEMQEKIQAICQHEYHVASWQQLDNKTLLVLARSLARRFSVPKTQISRLLGISSEVLDKLL